MGSKRNRCFMIIIELIKVTFYRDLSLQWSSIRRNKTREKIRKK